MARTRRALQLLLTTLMITIFTAATLASLGTPTVYAAGPDLTIFVSHSGSFLVGSGNAVYALGIGNASANPSTGLIAISDTLPNGMDYRGIASQSGGWSCSASGTSPVTVTCGTLSVIAGGGFSNVSISVGVGSGAVGQASNTATVSTADETNPGNNVSAADVVTVAFPPPDLTIKVFHEGSFFAGSTSAVIDYIISNIDTPGNGPTTGPTTITEDLPAGLKYRGIQGALPGWTCSGTTRVTCSNPNQFDTLNFLNIFVSIDPGTAGQVTHTASVATANDSNAANDTSFPDTIDIAPTVATPDLALSVGHSGQFFVGSTTATYTLSVSNGVAASVTTGSISIADTLPAGMSYHGIAGQSGGWSCTASGTATVIITCTNPGPITPGGQTGVSILVDIATGAVGSATNTATVTTAGDATTGNNTATDTVTVDAAAPPPIPPDLAIFVQHEGQFTVGSTTAIYVLTLFNGPINSTAPVGPTTQPITITDTLPTGITFRSLANHTDTWDCRGLILVTCTSTTPLPPSNGLPLILALNVDINASVARQVTNIATVTTFDDSNAANNTSPPDVADVAAAPPAPDLTSDVRHFGTFELGSTSAGYKLTAINDPTAGPTTGPITLTDTLPTGMTYRAISTQTGGWTCTATSGSPSTVTCTNPGPLAGGFSASSVSILVDIAGSAGGQQTNRVTVSTPGDSNHANDTSLFDAVIVAVPQFALTVSTDGPGTVVSSPAGLDCGIVCSKTLNVGATVNLTANPRSSARFLGWGGACSGTGPCSVTMTSAMNVTARFMVPAVGVQVGRAPTAAAATGPELTASLTARVDCGTIDHIQFGEPGSPFANASVTVLAPAGGPAAQTVGFSYAPPPGTQTVSLKIQRIVQSGGATVSPIRFVDGCGEWRTLVGGGPDAFR